MTERKRLTAAKVRAVLKKALPKDKSVRVKLSNWTEHTPGWDVRGGYKLETDGIIEYAPISVYWNVHLFSDKDAQKRSEELGKAKVLEALKKEGITADDSYRGLVENVRWAE